MFGTVAVTGEMTTVAFGDIAIDAVKFNALALVFDDWDLVVFDLVAVTVSCLLRQF
jgi:hypothetical protein